jgi:cytochrome c biogenesis protein CcmG/thiol:disulfide interchange protein DsbE
VATQEFYSGKILYPVTLALLILSLLFGFAILPRLFAAPEEALVGKPAPDFSLPVVANDDRPNLALHDLQGSAVVLDFWATWCGPCQAEAPIINRLAQRYHDRGVVVVGVDTDDQAGSARAWADKHGLSYPIVFDERHAAAEGYGVVNLPTLVVVSRAGKVVAVREGLTQDDELEGLVRQAL